MNGPSKNKSEEKLKRKVEKKLHKEKRKIRKLEKQMILKKDFEKKKEKLEEPVLGDGRSYTVSVALPGSILDNAQSPELRTYLAGQIARACVVFQVDEIIVFDESASSGKDSSTQGDFTGVGKKGNCNIQLARILQYLECPQYLRKSFFPKHKDLQYAGVLNPLDCPHHMREQDNAEFREGVVVDRPIKPGKGSFVDCGTLKTVQIDKVLQPNIRVTVKIKEQKKKYILGEVVPPHYPRTKGGLYWGYNVRLANSLSSAIVDCPYSDTGKYDITIGTSDKGEPVADFKMPTFKHLLIVFGGLQGLEAGLEADEALGGDIELSLLFDKYLNTCPNQGSRTIRTEEAILVTMSTLWSQILSNQP
uniref:28S rRNA (uridine-N(3))-methyltransferase n=1 Tax=Ciona intestinalis TaxID=7719 RepID=F6QCQ5_CIOIN|nr:putative methyltransferase C9orf114 [Ciona intestinalis]|eukprot:XP_002131245.1 putative methyltransferase C9orf114 [Ciona intestinalis]